MKKFSKFIVMYLHDHYGMYVYHSKEEFIKFHGEQFDTDDFDKIISEMTGDYEVLEINSEGIVHFHLEVE